MYPSSKPTPRPGDTEQLSLDPFILGLMAGAIAAIMCLVIGVAYYLLS